MKHNLFVSEETYFPFQLNFFSKNLSFEKYSQMIKIKSLTSIIY